MKKQFLYLMAAAASLTACSTNDVIGDADGTVDAQYDGSINIGATINALSITTKASGTRATVGGMDQATDNVWSGKEPLYFFMMEKGTIKPATELKSNSTSEYQNIYWNELAYAKTGEDAGKATVVVTRKDNAIKYYPISDAWDNGTYGFDFYGYHGGTATTTTTDGTANEPAYYSATTGEDGTITAATSTVTDGNIVGVAFEIDGSQDIMSGKAVVTDAQKAKLADADVDRAFSAYTARRGVQPSIDFNHRLTRLVFKVMPGEESTAGYAATDNSTTSLTANDTVEAMKVVGIKVVGKYKNKGLIVAASTDDAYKNKLIWTAPGENETNTFELRDDSDKVISKDNNNGKSLTGTFENEKFSGTETEIGDALMLEPGYDSYAVVLTLEQKVCEDITKKKNNGSGNTDQGWTTKYQEVTGTIKAPTGTGDGQGTFTEGYSYEVKITVHGFQPIDVTANLIGWKNGGNTDADTDNMKPYKEETKTEK